jgi:hypothetical protein
MQKEQIKQLVLEKLPGYYLERFSVKGNIVSIYVHCVKHKPACPVCGATQTYLVRYYHHHIEMGVIDGFRVICYLASRHNKCLGSHQGNYFVTPKLTDLVYGMEVYSKDMYDLIRSKYRELKKYHTVGLFFSTTYKYKLDAGCIRRMLNKHGK